MLKKMLSFGPFFIEEEEKEQVRETDSSQGSPSTEQQKTQNNTPVITILSTVIVLLVLILIGGGYFYYLQINNTKVTAQTIIPPQPSPIQLPVVEEVGKHIVLPTSENPTIATVADITKLANQPFFANAKNGDKVLLYPKAAVAYLYRPSIDKIITMGPLTITQSQPVASSKHPTIPGNLDVLGAATVAAGIKFEK